jgi:hypothetical protein
LPQGGQPLALLEQLVVTGAEIVCFRPAGKGQMQRVQRSYSPFDKGRRLRLDFINQLKAFARQLQEHSCIRLSFGIGNVLDLEFQGLRGKQLQRARFHQPQDRQDSFRFNVDAWLGSVVEGALQATGIQVNAGNGHYLILLKRRSQATCLLSPEPKPQGGWHKRRLDTSVV